MLYISYFSCLSQPCLHYLCLTVPRECVVLINGAAAVNWPSEMFFCRCSLLSCLSVCSQHWEDDVRRFHRMFRHSPDTELVVLVGNHDIGFHYE